MTDSNISTLVDNDANEIGRVYALARASIIDSVHYQIQCGVMLRAKKESMPHGRWLPWLEENGAVLGFDTRQTAAALMRTAVKCNAGVTFDAPKALAISRETWGHKGDGELITQSNSVEWYTPHKYIESARAVLGRIDLDPASCDKANEIVVAGRYFTAADDGLTKEWAGRIWLNPPYGKACSEFVAKLCAEYDTGEIQAAILLVNSNSTDTCWFAPLWDQVMCFTDHRINFYTEHGGESGPTHGSCFVYFGDENEKFAKEFSHYGGIVTRFVA